MLQPNQVSEVRTEFCSTVTAYAISRKVQMLQLRQLREVRTELCSAVTTNAIAG